MGSAYAQEGITNRRPPLRARLYMLRFALAEAVLRVRHTLARTLAGEPLSSDIRDADSLGTELDFALTTLAVVEENGDEETLTAAVERVIELAALATSQALAARLDLAREQEILH
jgi:hypothetical protein